MDQYYLSRHCAVCDELTAARTSLCPRCTADACTSIATLCARLARLERQHRHMVRVCLHCGGGGGGGGRATARPVPAAAAAAVGEADCGADTGLGLDCGGDGYATDGGSAAAAAAACAGSGGIVCDSLDCGVYFERRKLALELSALSTLQAAAEDLWDST